MKDASKRKFNLKHSVFRKNEPMFLPKQKGKGRQKGGFLGLPGKKSLANYWQKGGRNQQGGFLGNYIAYKMQKWNEKD